MGGSQETLRSSVLEAVLRFIRPGRIAVWFHESVGSKGPREETAKRLDRTSWKTPRNAGQFHIQESVKDVERLPAWEGKR